MPRAWLTAKISNRPLPEAIPPLQAAEILGVSVVTIKRWIRQHRILAYRVGPTLVRIPRSEIARLRRIRAVDRTEGYRPPVPPRLRGEIDHG
jgi:excisionase family DNA binding protein